MGDVYENTYFLGKKYFPNGTILASIYGMKRNDTHNRKDAKMADFIAKVNVEETTPQNDYDLFACSDCCYAPLEDYPKEGELVICPHCGEWSETLYL